MDHLDTNEIPILSSSAPRRAAIRSRKGTWRQAVVAVALPVFLFLGFRWIVLEPYTIPSGSMIPTLLVHDLVLVDKFSLGLRVPFTRFWIWHWGHPNRGSVVVFAYPPQPETYYIKRVVGLPGDTVAIHSGVIWINGTALATGEANASELLQELDVLPETKVIREEQWTVQYRSTEVTSMEEVVVPQGHYFVLGDNRNDSQDSRVWGFVPVENLVGIARRILLSCEESVSFAASADVESSGPLCPPQQMRWSRFLKSIQ